MKKNRSIGPRAWLLFWALSALAPRLFSQALLPSSPEVVKARNTFLRAGAPFPIDAFPTNAATLQAALDGLQGKAAPESDPGSYTLGVDAVAAYYYRYRGDEVLLEEGPHRDAVDFTRSYLEQPAFMTLGLRMTAPRGFSIETDGELRREWHEDWFKPSNFMESLSSGNPLAFDNNLMSRGVLYWRADAASFSLGRDKIHYGPSLEGTLYPSERLPYWDSARARVALGPLTMDWFTATIQARKARKATPDVDPGDGFGFETDHEEDSTPTIILSSMHRFSWGFRTLRLGVAGLQVVSRRNNYFHISDIFPVFSWHGGDVRQNNLVLLADLSWVPVSGLALNAVAGVDEVSAEGFGVGDSGVPTIPAYVVGIEYSPALSFGEGAVRAEAGYTHYLWGNYDGEETNGLDPNPLSRAIFRYLRDGGSVLMPLTSPYGPGALWFKVAADFSPAASNAAFGVEATVISKNTMANLTGTAYEESTEVENAPRVLYASLRPSVEYRLGSARLYFAPAILVQDSKWWGEIDLGVTLTYSGRFRL